VSPRSHPLWAAVAARTRGHRRVAALTWAAAVASLLGTLTVAEVARAATMSSSQPPGATSVVPQQIPGHHRLAHASGTPTHTVVIMPTPRATHRHPSPSPSPVLTAPTTPPASPTTPPVVVSSGS
jgi:hypothetical protein